jgi:hydrogenase large subunit
MARIVIDPITRIEGHLRIDVEVDGGSVKNAWASGQMWRGIENILLGRDPREAWIFTQRFCGVCTTVHAIASVRTVENALGLEIPLNAQYIRNLIVIAHALHDHIVHFYHLSALDWVDVVSALQGDAGRTSALAESLSPWPNNGRAQIQATKDKLAGFVAVHHFLQALEVQRKANQVVTILGSKTPNIQNLAVGGVANAINLDNQATLNMDKLWMVKSLLDEVVAFVQQVYVPDVCAIGAMYPEWLGHGKGVTNYLAVPDLPIDTKGTQFDLPGGTIMGGDFGSFKAIKSFDDPYFKDNVEESIAHSWYDGSWQKHPFEETTDPKYTKFEDDGKYSWVKAPRFQGQPMQVGPLAQVLVGYVGGHEPTKRWADLALKTVSSIAKVQVTPAMLHSTIGRHAARAIRTAVISELGQKHWKLLVDNIAKGDTTIFNPPTFPAGEVRGFGFHEAPRGTLSHWAVIQGGKIKNYQAVVPTTWNASPRDAKDQKGPYEASLLGNPIADPKRPLEVLRTVHSFDPCLACAVHTLDPEGREIARVKVL